MEEAQVTVDGTTYAIPDPFFVIATQNPAGFVGTYPLPEAQLDRFSLRIRMGYPTEEEEVAILRARKSGDPIENVSPVGDENTVRALIACSEKIRVAPEIERYVVSLVAATRTRPEFSLGASPRASLALMKLSRAAALLSHRAYVVPEDVANLYKETLSHRVCLTREAAAEGKNAEGILDRILSETPVPFFAKERGRTV